MCVCVSVCVCVCFFGNLGNARGLARGLSKAVVQGCPRLSSWAHSTADTASGACATAVQYPMLCHRSACCRHSMAAASQSLVCSLGSTRTRSVPSVSAQRRDKTVRGRDAKAPTVTAAPHKNKRKETAQWSKHTSVLSPDFPLYYDVLAALAVAYCFYSNIRFALSL